MNMNRLSKQCIVFIAGMISFLYVLGLVGHQDYIEEILYNMPQETYDVIVQKLGNVSRSEIALNMRRTGHFMITLTNKL